MKKLWSLMLVIAVTVNILSGCGTKQKDSNSTASTDPAVTTPFAEETSDKQITITMLYSGTQAPDEDFEVDVLPKMIKEKFPNINLVVTKLPDDQYYTSLKTNIATSEAPDIFLVQPRWAGANSCYALAKVGYLLDISDLTVLKNGGGANVADLTYQGKTYAITNGVTFLGTFYNKDLFDANDLTVPQNWDEFLNVCEVLKNAGITPIVMGDRDSYVLQFGLYQLAANVIYPSNPEFDNQLGDGTTKFTDGQWEKVLSMYATLYEKGYIMENSLGLGAAQAMKKFIDGEAAMTFDGSFNTSGLTAIGADGDFERGFFPCSGNAVGTPIYIAASSGGGTAIYAETKYADECRAILDYWYDGKSDLFKAWASRGDTILSFGEGVENNPIFQNTLDLFQKGQSFYWCNQAWPAGIENEMEVKFSELIGGQKITPAQISESMQAKFEELYTK